MIQKILKCASTFVAFTLSFAGLADTNTPAAAPFTGVTTDPLPDLHVAENDLGDDRKFIVFHKAGVTVQQAEEDMKFCWHFVPRGLSRQAPDFIPWATSAERRVVPAPDGGMFGLSGMVVAAIIAGPLERSWRQSRLYNCMLPRGYSRYRTSEAIWKLLNDDSQPLKSIQLQARIAAGPPPPTERLEP